MPFQTVFNKMSLDHIPDELKDFKKLEKIFISKKIIFKKIPMMQGTAIYISNSEFMLYFTKACRFKRIDCGKIKTTT